MGISSGKSSCCGPVTKQLYMSDGAKGWDGVRGTYVNTMMRGPGDAIMTSCRLMSQLIDTSITKPRRNMYSQKLTPICRECNMIYVLYSWWLHNNVAHATQLCTHMMTYVRPPSYVRVHACMHTQGSYLHCAWAYATTNDAKTKTPLKAVMLTL